jgi:hypothetical protein
MNSEELKKFKQFVITSLRESLEYPQTKDEEEIRQAEIINQKILNAINKILKL